MDDDDDLFGLDLPPPPKVAPPRQEPAKKPPKTRHTGERPTEVPILVQDDMVWLGKFQNGKRDLRYWMFETFGEGTDIQRQAEEALGEIIRDWAGCLFATVTTFVEQANRNLWPNLARQAVFWNEMLHQIGYTVPKTARYDPGPRETP